MKTAVEWLVKIYLQTNKIDSFDIEQAKEMQKQQMKEAVLNQVTTHPRFRKIFEEQFEHWFNETYGSKGSDETKGGELATFNTSSQTEISDEEIYKQADKEFRHFEDEDKDIWIRACQWYREQLKQK